MPVPSGEVNTILDLLRARAECLPQLVAVAAQGRRPVSYRDLWEGVRLQIGQLCAFGIRPDNRVALVPANGPDMALAFLGVTSVATCAPLNPDYREQEFEFFLKDLRARALILEAGSTSPAREVARRLGVRVVELESTPGAEPGILSLRSACGDAAPRAGLVRPENVALVLHTSGITSRPKMVPLTHTNLLTSAGNVQEALALTSDDRCLDVMPLFHIHGLVAALLGSLTAGGTVFCSPGFLAPRFFEWMDEARPTWCTAVPTMHQAVLARAETNREVIGRCPLRFIRSSSSALPPQVMAQLENAMGVPVIEAYGMTEAAHQVASNPLPARTRNPGSVGLPAGPAVAVMDEAGRILGPDQPVYGLQAVGVDGMSSPHTRIEEMAAHYLREVRNLQPEGPY